MPTKEHYNAHRNRKKTIQINLEPAEGELVDGVKNLRGLKSYRQLLTTLCTEELERLVSSTDHLTLDSSHSHSHSAS